MMHVSAPNRVEAPACAPPYSARRVHSHRMRGGSDWHLYVNQVQQNEKQVATKRLRLHQPTRQQVIGVVLLSLTSG